MTVSIHTMIYEKREIHRQDMRKVTRNHRRHLARRVSGTLMYMSRTNGREMIQKRRRQCPLGTWRRSSCSSSFLTRKKQPHRLSPDPWPFVPTTSQAGPLVDTIPHRLHAYWTFTILIIFRILINTDLNLF